MREIEIKNFLGMSTRRTPEINECADCDNFELRETSGDLVASPGLATYLTPPDFASAGFTLISNLGFTNHVFSQLPTSNPTPQDVTFYFQRGTVGGYPHIAIGMNPYYANGVWNSGWSWLNQIEVRTIDSIISTYRIRFTNAYYAVEDWIVYNVTKDKWTVVTGSPGGAYGDVDILVTNDVSTWAGSDVVILMKNYEPFGTAGAYYTAKSSITTSNLSFHRILNELRVGFGSAANRLGISIGHKKKYFQIDTLTCGATLSKITDLDNVVLDPYNIISDSGTYSLETDDDYVPGSISGTNFIQFPIDGKYSWHYLAMTVILDDFNEFVVYQSTSPFYIGSGSPFRIIKPKIRFATMNKRVTKIRIWDSANSTGDRTSDYRLIKELDVAKLTALTSGAKGWTLGSDGFLILSDVTAQYYNGFFNLDYAAFSAKTDTLGINLSDALGYTPTLEYASSWDQAVVSGASTYLLNPYVEKSWKNFIFNSPISGAGAAQYDVITAENYQSLDSKDGNDIVGTELNSSLDFSVFRTNGFQQYDPINQVPSQMISGNGAVSRLGIVNTGGVIVFPASTDIFINSGNQVINITENSIRDIYREFTDNERAGIVAGKDRDGSYRFRATSHYEYIFVKGKGWIKYSTSDLAYYGNKKDGSILFMDATSNDGSIAQLDSTKGVNSSWTSVPIDISLLGPELTSDQRFIVNSIWAEYLSDKPIALSISFDGAAFESIGSFEVNPGKVMTGVFGSDATDRFTKTNHGLVDNNRIIFSSIGSLTGISTNKVYYIVTDETDTFQISLTQGGSPINLGGAGSNCTLYKIPTSSVKGEVRIPPGRNAKYFQFKVSITLLDGDLRTHINAMGIRWNMFKTGLFR